MTERQLRLQLRRKYPHVYQVFGQWRWAWLLGCIPANVPYGLSRPVFSQLADGFLQTYGNTTVANRNYSSKDAAFSALLCALRKVS